MEASSKRKRKISELEGSDPKFAFAYEKLDNLTTENLKDENCIISIKHQKDINVLKNNQENNHIKILKTSISIDATIGVLKKLNRESYPYLFIFIIDVKNSELTTAENSPNRAKQITEKIYEIKAKIAEFGKRRPIILQLTTNDEHLAKFYYKDDKEKSKLNEIIDVQNIVSDPNNFPFILNELFKKKIAATAELVISIFESIKNSSLVLRLFMIFDLDESIWYKLILKCAAYGSVNDLLAVLDEPFNNDKGINTDTQVLARCQQDVAMEVDEDFDVSSSNQENKQIIEYLKTNYTHLIQFLPFEHQVRISTTAFNEKQYKILCDLIEHADFPYPENFTESNAEENERLNEITKKRMELKNAIEKEDTKKIDNLIGNDKNLKFMYNIENSSALEQAILLRKFEVHYYLKSRGLTSKNCKKSFAKLSEKEKKEATKHERKRRRLNIDNSLQDFHKPVLLLTARSLIFNKNLSRKQEKEYRMKMRKWFEDIFKIAPEMMKVAASCEELQMIFDFESNTTEASSLGVPNSSGVTYPVSKWIFMGAKVTDKASEQKIKGVLAHELCHFVMRLVYENDENPYYKHRLDLREKFEKIVNLIDKWSKSESMETDDECFGIISSVFTQYGKKEFHLELIVRVVQILIQFDNDNDKTKNLQKKYNELFEFWSIDVLPELTESKLKRRENQRILNKTFKLLSSIKQCKIELSSSNDIKSVLENKLVIITTNNPRLLLIDIYEHLLEIYGDLLDLKNVFVDSKELNVPEIFENFKKLFKRKSKLNIFVDCSLGVSEKLMDLNLNSYIKIYFIVEYEKQAEEVKLSTQKHIQNFTAVELNYKWHDLTHDSQKSLFNTNINFQNTQIKLLDIINKPPQIKESSTSKKTGDQSTDFNTTDITEIIDDMLLNLLTKNGQISINRILEDSINFECLYQPRNFEISWNNSFSVNKFVQKVQNEQYVIIADKAGNGKSWMMKKLAQTLLDLNPSKWVTYVDLKEFIQKFKAQLSQDTDLQFSKFLIENILNLSNKFEEKIFSKMYEIGKVSIIFDGFDEIAPNYAKFVTNLAKSFKSNEGNQLWIATRDYFQVDLVKELQTKDAYKLDSFSERMGAELITRSWIIADMKTKALSSKDDFENVLEGSSKYQEYNKIAKSLITRISMTKKRTIGMPQMYSIIADITKDDKDVTINFSETELYEQLVDKLYSTWDKKGEIRHQSNIKIQKSNSSFYTFHQYLAIKKLFPYSAEDLFKKNDKSKWSNEEIVACGIVDIKNGVIRFHHETFCEYFVVNFIIQKFQMGYFHEKVLLMFVDVMTDEKSEIIRMFLNNALEDSILRNNITLKMQKFVLSFQNMKSLEDIFTHGLKNLEDFVIQVLKEGDKDKMSKFFYKNACQTFNKALHKDSFDRFINHLFNYCNDDIVKKLVTEDGLLLNLIESRLDIDSFDDFVKTIESKFDSAIVTKGIKLKFFYRNNIFFYFFESLTSSYSKFERFLDTIKNYLTADDIYNLMKNCDSNKSTVLQIIFEKRDNPMKFWNKIKTLINNDSFENLVQKEDLKEENILYNSLNIGNKDYRNFLNEMFAINDLYNFQCMFFKLNKKGISFIHKLMDRMYFNDNNKKIIHTVTFLNEKIKTPDFGKILKCKHKLGKTLFENVLEKGIKDFQFYKSLWEALRRGCDSDIEFINILNKSINSNIENIFQLMIQYDSSLDVLEYLLNEIENFPTCDETRDLLDHRMYNDHFLLTIFTVEKDHFKYFKRLWNVYCNHFNTREFLRIIKRNCNIYKNLMCHIVGSCDIQLIKFCWQQIEILEGNDKLHLAHYLRSENSKYDLIDLSSKNDKLVQKWIETKLKEYDIFDENAIFAEFVKEFNEFSNSEDEIFLEKLLTKYEENFIKKNCQQNFKYFLITPDKSNLTILHYSALRNHTKFLQILLKRILNIDNWSNLKPLTKQNKDYNVIVQMFKEINCNGESILHSAIKHANDEVFEIFLESLEGIASDNEILEILKQNDEFDYNRFHKPEINDKLKKNPERSWKCNCKDFDDYDTNPFGLLKDQRRLDVLQNAYSYFKLKIVDLVWDNLVKRLNQNELIQYVCQNFEKLFNPTCYSTGQRQWLKNIFFQNPKILITIKFNDNDNREKTFLKESLKSTYKTCNIIYHIYNSLALDCINFEMYLDSLQHYLNAEEIFDLIKTCNDQGDSILHYCIKQGHKNQLVNLLTAIEVFLKKSNMPNAFKELLMRVNSKNYNLCMLLASNNKLEFHKTIWEYFDESMDGDDMFNCYFKTIDENGENFAHLIVQHVSDPNVVKYIFDGFNKRFLKDHLQEGLALKGSLGRNLLQIALIHAKSSQIFKYVWKIFLDTFASSFQKFIFKTNDSKENLIVISARYSSGRNFVAFVDCMKSTLKPPTTKTILFPKLELPFLFQHVVHNQDILVHETLWKFIREYLTKKEIEEIIKYVDNHLDFLTTNISDFTKGEIKNLKRSLMRRGH